MKWFISLCFTVACLTGVSQQTPGVQQTPGTQPDLKDVKTGLDSLLFVRRFRSIETACIVIDPANPTRASVPPDMVNSNYRVTKSTGSGVLCLSENCAQYLRLSHTNYVDSNQTITGHVELTYGYPASSIIQYLGMTAPRAENEKSQVFFNYLLHSEGEFVLYKFKDRYQIRMRLTAKPYSPEDTIYGYLEIVRPANVPLGPAAERTVVVYEFFFDHMQLHRGDDNQIFQKYTNASFRSEAMYYTKLLADGLMGSKNDPKEARNAIWLANFYGSPYCPMCAFIFNQAKFLSTAPSFSRPNTDPYPAH